MNIPFLLLCFLVCAFAYINGFHDGCNVVATLIASRSMKPHKALMLASVVEAVSPFSILLIGSSVSRTIQQIVSENYYMAPEANKTAAAFIAGGILAAIIWNLYTWKFAVPSSSSHALIGGILGAGIVAFGVKAISWNYFLLKVVLMIFISPTLGFIAGLLVMKITLYCLRGARMKVKPFFRYAQWINMSFLAYNHSLNDSQKSIGVMLILINIFIGETEGTPVLVIAVISLCIASGILFGGYRIIKTVGTGIYKIKEIHSFTSQATAATTILVSSLLGAPVSSSQIVSSSIMGVGAAEHYKFVNWIAAKKIVISWFITIPIAGTIGGLLCLIIMRIY